MDMRRGLFALSEIKMKISLAITSSFFFRSAPLPFFLDYARPPLRWLMVHPLEKADMSLLSETVRCFPDAGQSILNIPMWKSPGLAIQAPLRVGIYEFWQMATRLAIFYAYFTQLHTTLNSDRSWMIARQSATQGVAYCILRGQK